MAVTLRDDKGQEVRLEGDWTGRLVGQDFTNGGQIMVWLKPGADGWLEPVARAAEIESPTRSQQLARVTASITRAQQRAAKPHRELTKGD